MCNNGPLTLFLNPILLFSDPYAVDSHLILKLETRLVFGVHASMEKVEGYIGERLDLNSITGTRDKLKGGSYNSRPGYKRGTHKVIKKHINLRSRGSD